ncbi:MAG: hypothetical protein FD126_198 [Elusimicrobia bacterium]|nr:MAG: hypothetical protein FD126_198 [Elusimicrobiota bacterium]
MKKFFVLMGALLTAGCAGREIQNVRQDFIAPDLIVMLPPDNQSVDLTAPKAVIGALASSMIGLGYFPFYTPAQEVALRGMGITDGGQLRAFKLEDISSRLGVDGLVKTEVRDFGKVNLGFYIQGKVASHLSLHDAAGDLLWEADAKYSEAKMTLSVAEAITAGASELTGDLVARIFKAHLVPESQVMAGLFAEKAKTNRPSLCYPGPGFKAK